MDSQDASPTVKQRVNERRMVSEEETILLRLNTPGSLRWHFVAIIGRRSPLAFQHFADEDQLAHVVGIVVGHE